MDLFYHPRNVKLVGSTGSTPRLLPPSSMHPRNLGWSWSMWLNVTSIQSFPYYQNVWQSSWRDQERGGQWNNFSIAVQNNFTMRFSEITRESHTRATINHE